MNEEAHAKRSVITSIEKVVFSAKRYSLYYRKENSNNNSFQSFMYNKGSKKKKWIVKCNHERPILLVGFTCIYSSRNSSSIWYCPLPDCCCNFFHLQRGLFLTSWSLCLTVSPWKCDGGIPPPLPPPKKNLRKDPMCIVTDVTVTATCHSCQPPVVYFSSEWGTSLIALATSATNVRTAIWFDYQSGLYSMNPAWTYTRFYLPADYYFDFFATFYTQLMVSASPFVLCIRRLISQTEVLLPFKRKICCIGNDSYVTWNSRGFTSISIS